MKKLISISLSVLFALAGSGSVAQRLVLNSGNNRFLINEPSGKPRLDVIIRNFTTAEKQEMAALAVMDTVTKPVVRTAKEGFHDLTLGRMAEQMTLVVRDADQMPDGYFIEFDGRAPEPDQTNRLIESYELGKEHCAAGPSLPFGNGAVTVSLCGPDGQTLSELRIKLIYPKPEVFYVYVHPRYDIKLSDTTELRRLLHFFIRNKPAYSAPNAVPDSLSIAESTLFFGFKKAYYDGKLQDTRIVYRVGRDRPWIGTVKEMHPFIELAQKIENWTWLSDGRYDLQFGYTMSDATAGKYSFTVDHHWLNSLAYNGQMLLTIVPVVILMRPWLLALILCLITYFWFRRRLRNSRDLAMKTNLELQSIQSQLNPHFVFNALSSLQGLINNHDIDKANHYLSGFSKLLRNTLHQSGKEMVPLKTEVSNMENYIKLEQLRFNFEYRISVDPQLANLQIEVPALLIQPVLENAVKHGIAILGDAGRLALDFSTTGSDIIIKIQDNGSGYDISSGSDGKGLALTCERIKLLNKGGYSIDMRTLSDSSGTTVTFNLKKWI